MTRLSSLTPALVLVSLAAAPIAQAHLQRTAAAEAPRQNKAAPAETAAPGSTTVSGVTVTLSKTPPRVVSTYPALGAAVAPGVLVLRVTFDQPMFGESWSYVTSADGEYPDCAPTPRRLDDKKSFALICRVVGGRTYALWLNRGPYANFVSLGRRASKTYELKFTTSHDDPIWTLKDAMANDAGLPPGSNPAQPGGIARPGQAVVDPDTP